MIDRMFTLTLTFAILAGATLAVGDEYFSTQPNRPAPIVAKLPRVMITGQIQPTLTEVASAEPSADTNATKRMQ